MRQPMGKQWRMLHRLRGSEGDQTSDARSPVSWWIKNHVRSASIVYHSYVSYVNWAYLVETHSFNLVWSLMWYCLLIFQYLQKILIKIQKTQQKSTKIPPTKFHHQHHHGGISPSFLFRLRKLGVLARCWWSLSVDLMSSGVPCDLWLQWVQVMNHWEGWGAKKQNLL